MSSLVQRMRGRSSGESRVESVPDAGKHKVVGVLAEIYVVSESRICQAECLGLRLYVPEEVIARSIDPKVKSPAQVETYSNGPHVKA